MARGMARLGKSWGVKATAWAVLPLGAVLLLAWWGTGSAGAAGDLSNSDSNDLHSAVAYAELVSSLGIVLGSVAAGICFVGAAMQRSMRSWAFFILGGVLSTILLLDDVFVIHSAAVAPMLGVAASVTYAIYAALAGMYVLAFRRRILSGAVVPLAGALGLLATAMMLDMLLPTEPMLADSIRLLGIGCWGTYFAVTGLAQAPAGPGGQAGPAGQALALRPIGEPLTGSATALGVLAELAREAADRRDQARADRLPDIIAVTTEAWSVPPKVTVRAWRRAA